MTDHEKNDADKPWRDCLHLVQSLRDEMNTALSALAANDLERFESSVAAQERLCESVRGLALSGAKPEPNAQLAAAGHELRRHNRIYLAALVRAAQTSAALLSLYQDSPRGYSPNGRDASTARTLSCEV